MEERAFMGEIRDPLLVDGAHTLAGSRNGLGGFEEKFKAKGRGQKRASGPAKKV